MHTMRLRTAFIFLGAIAGTGLAIAATPAETIDLPGAIDRALAQNKPLAQAAMSIRSALLGVEAAKLPFEVQVRPAGSASMAAGGKNLSAGLNVNKRLTWGTDLQAAAVMSSGPGLGDTNLYQGSLSLQVSQPLLKDAGRLVNLEPVIAAESRQRAAHRLVEMKRADLVLEVVRTYVDILRLGRQVAYASEAVGRLERLLKLTEALERLGRASRVDSLRVELQLGQAKSTLDSHGRNLDAAMKDFAELLGEDLDKTFSLAPVPLQAEPPPPPLECSQAAFSNRLDLAQAIADSRDAERGVRISAKNMWPSLRLNMRYELSSRGDDLQSAAKLDESIWFVGLSSDTDLRRSSEQVALKESLLNSEMASRQVEIVRDGVSKQSLQYASFHSNNLNQAQIAVRNCRLAESRRDLARKMFEMRRGDSFSVTDAESAYLAAQEAMIQAETAAILSGYGLRHVLGTLLESPVELRPYGRESKESAEAK